MAWAVPSFSKKRVNKAGQSLITDVMPDVLDHDGNYTHEYFEYLDAYFASLEVVNNWRSSHNFPLNTFHIGLRRRAKSIDPVSFTAQRIKRMASIELKLRRFPTMTLSQMQDIGGCRAIVSSAAKVKALCDSYEKSDIKHSLHQRDDYIAAPKDSGYRGVHLVYRYYSDKKQDYNSLKIEMQIRSQYQHAWATAVETVGAFVQQALKSSLGEQEWLRFFALMGTAVAVREDTPPVPGTPNVYSDVVRELREHARSLDVTNRLRAFSRALQVYESSTSNDHYYLVEVNSVAKTINVTGFKQKESDLATAKYLETEKKLKDQANSDAVLVSVDSIDALRRAYPNYFLDTGVFLNLMEETLKSERLPRKRTKSQMDLF